VAGRGDIALQWHPYSVSTAWLVALLHLELAIDPGKQA
jgi:hypothetical protein